MTESKNILIALKDKSEFKSIENQLNEDGFEVFYCQTGESLLKLINKYSAILIVLDLLLPDMDGIELLLKLKENKSLANCWIVFFTERSEDYSKVAGLEAGADDYITKPIKSRLLLAKIKSVLKRNKLSLKSDNSSLNRHGFTINRDNKSVNFNKKEIKLQKKELDLLSLFIEFPEKVFSRNQIKQHLWNGDLSISDRNIDVHISNLRSKLGKSYIQTIKGVGYKFLVSSK